MDLRLPGHPRAVPGCTEGSASLPAGWEQRAIEVSHPTGTRGHRGWCLEAHDLAASKLAAFREKDRVFVRTLLLEDLIDGRILIERLRSLEIETERKAAAIAWAEGILSDLPDRGRSPD